MIDCINRKLQKIQQRESERRGVAMAGKGARVRTRLDRQYEAMAANCIDELAADMREAGLSVAEQAASIGVERSYLYRVINHERMPSIDMLQRWARDYKKEVVYGMYITTREGLGNDGCYIL